LLGVGGGAHAGEAGEVVHFGGLDAFVAVGGDEDGVALEAHEHILRAGHIGVLLGGLDDEFAGPVDGDVFGAGRAEGAVIVGGGGGEGWMGGELGDGEDGDMRGRIAQGVSGRKGEGGRAGEGLGGAKVVGRGAFVGLRWCVGVCGFVGGIKAKENGQLVGVDLAVVGGGADADVVEEAGEIELGALVFGVARLAPVAGACGWRGGGELLIGGRGALRLRLGLGRGRGRGGQGGGGGGDAVGAGLKAEEFAAVDFQAFDAVAWLVVGHAQAGAAEVDAWAGEVDGMDGVDLAQFEVEVGFGEVDAQLEVGGVGGVDGAGVGGFVEIDDDVAAQIAPAGLIFGGDKGAGVGAHFEDAPGSEVDFGGGLVEVHDPVGSGDHFLPGDEGASFAEPVFAGLDFLDDLGAGGIVAEFAGAVEARAGVGIDGGGAFFLLARRGWGGEEGQQQQGDRHGDGGTHDEKSIGHSASVDGRRGGCKWGRGDQLAGGGVWWRRRRLRVSRCRIQKLRRAQRVA
jgi:hypothetical protein